MDMSSLNMGSVIGQPPPPAEKHPEDDISDPEDLVMRKEILKDRIKRQQRVVERAQLVSIRCVSLSLSLSLSLLSCLRVCVAPCCVLTTCEPRE